MSIRLSIPRLIIALTLAFAAPAFAQVVQGTVVDATTRTPIPLANISLLSDSGRVLATRVADTAGVFEIPVPRDDSVALRVESVGFATLTSQRFAVGRGQLLEVEIRLAANAIALEPMVVVARNPAPARLQEFYRRADLIKKLGQGRVWMREDLERLGVQSVRMLVDSQIMRPGIGCSGSAILLDDLPVSRSDLDMIHADELEGIEIYRDAMQIPPEYHQYCNLILMWRKPYDEGLRPFTWRRLLIGGAVAALLFFLATR